MKKFFITSVVVLAALGACSDKKKLEEKVDQLQQKVDSLSGTANQVAVSAPVITFEEKEFDFGTIKAGEVVKHTFKFKNTGKSPLVIENASAACGCTVPEWPKKPVVPGEEAAINVVFNSKGKSGLQNKVVSITANTVPVVTTVSIKGNVKAEEEKK